MTIETVLKKIESFLSGNISDEDFSYDFPVTYSLYAKQLDENYPTVSRLIQEELIPLCKKFDPFDFYHLPEGKVTDRDHFRQSVASIYERAKKLLKED